MGACASSSRDVETSRTLEGGENARIKYAAAAMQGFGIEMEDAHAVVPDLDHTTSFFGLYDGHGGHEVALLCARLFHIELQFHPNYQNDLDNAIRSVFSRMDKVLERSNLWRELVKPTVGRGNFLHRIKRPIGLPYSKIETPYIPPQTTGSSVSVAVIRGNRVIVGNVGDSHCIASRSGQAIQLSTDQRPRHRGEIRRIERAGGKIDIDQHFVREAGRVIGSTVFRGMLATSRAIGDFAFKLNKSLPPEEQMVICDPDILNMEITNDIEFLVIASHGIWASLTCQDVVDFVRKEFEYGVTDLRVICERLLRYAQPTVFDMTVILIQFKHDAADEAEDNDNQEIKSDARVGQEIKSHASPPPRHTAPRRLDLSSPKPTESTPTHPLGLRSSCLFDDVGGNACSSWHQEQGEVQEPGVGFRPSTPKRMEPVLPGPHKTIIIEENNPNPFDYIAEEMRQWLAEHDDEEDILVGDHANSDTIEDYDALRQLGPHPLLERQTKKRSPIRWMHVQFQLAGDPNYWFRSVLRADNLYNKGFINRRNGLELACYEFTEEPVQGKVSSNRIRLFPPDYNAVPLPWDLKYHETLGCDKDSSVILQLLKEMWDDPMFMTKAIKFFSFYDPTVGNPREAQKIMTGITFKLCECLRMRLNFNTPKLMEKVWSWKDVCKELRKWKEAKYDCSSWSNTKFEVMGIMGPPHALELVLLVLNKTDGAFKYEEALKLKMEKNRKSNDSHSSKKKDSEGFGAPKEHDSEASGSNKNKDDGSGCGKKLPTKNFSRVPFGHCRIQILSIRANFQIDDINVYDWHRGQKIYMKTSGYIGQEAGMRELLLCGPRRAIGAYGYLGIDIFPTESVIDTATKKRSTTGGIELISEYWDVSNYDDAEPSRHMEVLCGSSDRRVVFSYLHIPNAIEAEIKVRFYVDENCEISGFIKATATGYEQNFVELFRKENKDTLPVCAGEWAVVPLLVKVLCFPYRSNLHLILYVDLRIDQPGRRPRTLSCFLPFRTKYGKKEEEFGANKKIEVIVTMQPDPLS